MPEGATGPGEVSTIILAAGEGKRMRSATPKVLHRLAGRSLVEHAVRAAAGLAPQRMAVVVGHGREAVTEHLHEIAKAVSNDTAATVTVAVQEVQHGTGHAVRCALDELPGGLTGTVLVTYGDVPLLDTATLSALLAEHTSAGNAVTVLSAEVDDPTGYGRIVRTADGSVEAIVEQKDASAEQAAIREINSGVYAFDATVLATALGQLSSDNAQGEQYLTDVLGIARDAGHRVGTFGCTDPWLVEGVNDRVQLAALGTELNRRLTERWMREGVTMTDPSTVWLDAGVELARDVVLEPNVQLRGATTAGEGAVIGPDTTLTDVRVGAGARVVRTHGGEAEIGDGANVGPFAYLRPGTVLHDGGKIGTFVEVKNSEIGRGTKVPHLSYVGDATIGEYSNIGAASVFVNYDGVTKRRSTVGSYARTGCDNMFVAPVSVGDGAYTGAGAVLRQDVPPGALAVSAGVQRNIDGWVVRKRPGTPAAEAARRSLDETSDSSGSADSAQEES